MGAPRPRMTLVARRAAAIVVAGTMFVAMVVGTGTAAAGTVLHGGDVIGSTLVSVPSPIALQAADDGPIASVPTLRGHGDPHAGWAEPATVSVLLAEPVAFFIGLTDTSDTDATGRAVTHLHGRSPPASAAPVPR